MADRATAIHMSDAESLQRAEDGWFYPACSCGWKFPGPLPDLEIAVDALMDHAFEMGEGE